jgi:hypothetical protein
MQLNNVRLSYPNIFRASAFAPGQDEKYSAMFIMEKGSTAHQEMEAAIAEAIEEKWPKKPPGNLKICLRDGEEKDSDGFGPGVVFFNASSKKRPGVFDRDTSALVEDDGKPYAGCYVHAQINVWAQDNAFGKRINASLEGIQFYKDGEGFGGGGRASQASDFAVLDDDDDFLD